METRRVMPFRSADLPATLLLAALAALAWLALLLVGSSPYARFLEHHALDFSRPAGLVVLGFSAGWLLMIVAMMLPTTWPLVDLFQRLVDRRGNRWMLLSLLLLGYLSVWLLVGSIALVGDWSLHEFVHLVPRVEENSWVIAASVFLLAGAYQFSPLKYRCLTVCRAPRSFIARYWRGQSEGLESYALGVRHGLFCVGCCWSLMLLAFAIGVGNLTWMLVFGVIMAAEKNFPWGRRLSMPLGVVLVASGAGILLFGVT